MAAKADKTNIATTQPAGGMLSNVMYNFGELSSNTTFTLAAATDNSIANVWTWTFSTGETVPTITPPANISWVGSVPNFIANKNYEISVMNGVGVWMEA